MVRRRKVSPAARIFIRKNRAVIFGQPYFFVMGMGYLKNRGTQFLTFHFVYVILSSNCAFGLGLCAQRQELRNKDWRDCDEKICARRQRRVDAASVRLPASPHARQAAVSQTRSAKRRTSSKILQERLPHLFAAAFFLCAG